MRAMQRLREKYPDLFDRQYFHDLPDGWEWIVEAFIKSAKQWRWREGDSEVSNFSYLSIVQCKEKFGTLRLSITTIDDVDLEIEKINRIRNELRGAAVMAETLSKNTCAHCGTMKDNAAVRNNNGYYLALCDTCVASGAWKS